MTIIKKIFAIIVAGVLSLSAATAAVPNAVATTAASASVATNVVDSRTSTATTVATSTTTPVTTFGAQAAILTTCADTGRDSQNGAGIICILGLVVDIMTIGIGILAVIGITVSGIQYITAGGSEEQTRKAKRRIFEIVLGLAVYAVSYLLLRFLLPGFTGVHSSNTPDDAAGLIRVFHYLSSMIG